MSPGGESKALAFLVPWTRVLAEQNYLAPFRFPCWASSDPLPIGRRHERTAEPGDQGTWRPGSLAEGQDDRSCRFDYRCDLVREGKARCPQERGRVIRNR